MGNKSRQLAVEVIAEDSGRQLSICPEDSAACSAWHQAAEEKIRAGEDLYQSILAASPDGIAVTDLQGVMITVSTAALVKFAYQQSSDLTGRPVTDFLVPEDREKALTNMALMFRGIMTGPGEYRGLRSDGSSFDIEVNAEFIRDAAGQPQKMVFIVRDISDRKRTEVELLSSQRKLTDIIDFLPDATLAIDRDKKVIIWNRAIEKMTGIRAAEMIGQGDYAYTVPFYGARRPQLMDLILEDNDQTAGRYLQVTREGKAVIAEAYCPALYGGRGAWILVKASPLHDQAGAIIGVIESIRDISESKKKEAEILRLSYHDQLTGLYNRRYYEEELKRLDTVDNLPLTIAVGDLNGLKLVNDSFGHAVGDELLQKVAGIIRKSCRPGDVVSRLGGDEFVLILPKTDAGEAEIIIRRIRQLAAEENLGAIDISISFGYATKCGCPEKMPEIFKSAEDMMYKIKLFEGPSMRGKTISTIIKTLHEKNHREEQHSQRVSAICRSIGEAIGLPEHKIEELKSVGLLHDIGKIALDETVLNKGDRLNAEEWKEIRRHPEIGYRILSTVNEMAEMAEYVLHHHERWDGLGYPRGLKGEEISLAARIIAIADAFDAMTAYRTYRQRLSEAEAAAEIWRCAGSQFDPEIARVFVEKVIPQQWTWRNA